MDERPTLEGPQPFKGDPIMTEPGSPTTPTPNPPAPQPASEPQKKKGIGAIGWIAIGCLVLLLLAAGSCVVVGMFAKKKLTDVAHKIEKNPAMASAEMAVKLNPDLEVVDKDEDAGTMTIREKKTGKTMTLNVADIKKGKIHFSTDDGQDLSMEVNQNGLRLHQRDQSGKENSMEMGTGTGGGKLPAWLPAYPGATAAGGMQSKGPDGTSGWASYSSDDSVDDVAAYYKKVLEDIGFDVTRHDVTMNDSVSASLSARAEESGRTVELSVSRGGDEDRTAIVINYSDASAAE